MARMLEEMWIRLAGCPWLQMIFLDVHNVEIADAVKVGPIEAKLVIGEVEGKIGDLAVVKVLKFADTVTVLWAGRIGAADRC